MGQFNPRGSEWAKWDLHVHTPESLVHNFKSGDSTDVWEEFLTDLESLPPEFKVIGVNDYLFIDGYKKMLAFKKAGRLQNIELLLPVLEFRIKKFAGHDKFKRVNFHVIFSDELHPDLIQAQFLNGLTAKYKLATAVPEWSAIINRESLQDLGRRIKLTVPIERLADFDSDLIEGFNNLNLDEQEIINLLENNHFFTGKYLLAIGKTEWDELPWSDGTITEKKDIINKAHIVFTASESEDKFNSAKIKLTEQLVNDLLLDCSDAHHNKNSKEKDRIGNCLTWIKADRTFNGLRQIIIEPTRVFVGTEPEVIQRVRSNGTKYIDTLRIVKDPDSTLSEKWFEDIEIPLNHELVAVIGNKGNGKSALTDTLGLLGDSKSQKEFSFLLPSKFKKANPLNRAMSYNGAIQWHSGDINEKNLNDNVSSTAFERVKYLPQNYLEVLCNDEANEKKFESELRKVIFSHVQLHDRLNQDSLENLIAYRTEILDENISRFQLEIKEINRQIIDLETMRSAVNRKTIETALLNKETELREHQITKPPIVPEPEASAEIKSEQLAITATLQELRQTVERLNGEIISKNSEKLVINTEITVLNKAQEAFTVFEREFQNLKDKYANSLNQYGISFDEVIQLKINKNILTKRISSLQDDIQKIEDAMGSEDSEGLIKSRVEIDPQIIELQNKLDEPGKHYQEYLSTLRQWKERGDALQGSVVTEGTVEYYRAKIDYLNNKLVDDLNSLRTERMNKSKLLYETKQRKVDVYKELYNPVTTFMAGVQDLSMEYPISVNASLRLNEFANKFLTYINQGVKGSFYQEGAQVLMTLLEGRDFNEIFQVEEFLNSVIENLEFDQRQGYNREAREIQSQIKRGFYNDFYDFLFGLDYLEPSFELKLDDKHISELSPGEKGALLLIFYLILDRDEIPLVIDQPEENLDNQSVYLILVPFIKKAKRRRQIIIVTHNPNLAVVCDAEQIINVKIDKLDGFKVSVQSGAIESLEINRKAVDILEGTLTAFNNRDTKYSITKENELVS